MHCGEEKEYLHALLQGLVKKVQAGTDMEKIAQYRKIFRQSVPLLMRSYVAAYLCMEYLQNSPKVHKGVTKVPISSLDNQEKLFANQERCSLFISIGKNRRVYPHQLLAFIQKKTGLPREAFGHLRMLDNYSFIEVPRDLADSLITTLQGSLFKGKALVVNYARHKTDHPFEGTPETFSPKEKQTLRSRELI
ncbi:MAG: DbpA RNA binding domain-containing protein [Treponemataceae bacterium]|nr:DbpA RNA binding domain-containing protein [Treponemataceae bacterium]